MSFLLLLLPVFSGFLLAALFLKGAKLPAAGILAISLTLPLGWGIASLALFASCVLAGGQGYPLAVSLQVLLLAFLLVMNGRIWLMTLLGDLRPSLKSGPHESRYRLLAATFLLLALIFFITYFSSKASGNIMGGWDARYFWNMKARFYFRVPALWKGMFSPLLAEFGHPDYPLMLPGAVAWGWLSQGKESLLWPFWVALGFGLSLAGLVYWYLRAWVSQTVAFLGAGFVLSIPMFHFWSSALYAEVPLTGYMTAAGITLIAALRCKEPRLLTLSGLLTGLALWTKDEGWVFMVWMISVLVIALIKDQSMDGPQKRNWILLLLAGVALPVLASLLIKSVYGTTGGQYAGSGRSLGDFLMLLFGSPKKTQILTAVFFLFWINYEQWNGLWILFAAAAFLAGKNSLRDYRWVPALLVLMLHIGYFAIMHVTPHDLRFQIETALLRIMSHGMGLAVIFILEAAGRHEAD